MRITTRVSPNQNARPAGTVIDTIVLHSCAHPDPSPAGEDDVVIWLCNPKAKVSYHYYVRRRGDETFALVAPDRKAWHAGVSSFNGRANVNDFSVGVCLANTQQGEPYYPAQVAAAAALCAGLMRQFPRITLDRITSHAVVAPGRKFDPKALNLTAFRILVAKELAA